MATLLKNSLGRQWLGIQMVWTQKRKLLRQCLKLAVVIASVLSLWSLWKVLTNTESPVVVVLSGSMEPAIFRGDILFLRNSTRDVQVGDIVVFRLEGREVPIVHRIMRKVINATTYNSNGSGDEDEDEWLYLTKGDANRFDDKILYPPGQDWILRSQMSGKAVAVLRYLGFATIMLNDYPILKYVLLGLMAFTTMMSPGGG